MGGPFCFNPLHTCFFYFIVLDWFLAFRKGGEGEGKTGVVLGGGESGRPIGFHSAAGSIIYIGIGCNLRDRKVFICM